VPRLEGPVKIFVARKDGHYVGFSRARVAHHHLHRPARSHYFFLDGLSSGSHSTYTQVRMLMCDSEGVPGEEGLCFGSLGPCVTMASHVYVLVLCI
jgi:hypothetical protein